MALTPLSSSKWSASGTCFSWWPLLFQPVFLLREGQFQWLWNVVCLSRGRACEWADGYHGPGLENEDLPPQLMLKSPEKWHTGQGFLFHSVGQWFLHERLWELFYILCVVSFYLPSTGMWGWGCRGHLMTRRDHAKTAEQKTGEIWAFGGIMEPLYLGTTCFNVRCEKRTLEGESIKVRVL